VSDEMQALNMENVLEIPREDEEMIDAINSDYHDGLCEFLESEKKIDGELKLKCTT
jgi:hypothetical protein